MEITRTGRFLVAGAVMGIAITGGAFAAMAVDDGGTTPSVQVAEAVTDPTVAPISEAPTTAPPVTTVAPVETAPPATVPLYLPPAMPAPGQPVEPVSGPSGPLYPDGYTETPPTVPVVTIAPAANPHLEDGTPIPASLVVNGDHYDTARFCAVMGIPAGNTVHAYEPNATIGC